MVKMAYYAIYDAILIIVMTKKEEVALCSRACTTPGLGILSLLPGKLTTLCFFDITLIRNRLVIKSFFSTIDDKPSFVGLEGRNVNRLSSVE